MDMIDAYPWLLVPLIFAARVLDVSMGTVRTILLVRGQSMIAASIGFVEVLIWLAAAGQVLNRLDAWYLAVAYASGFATGNLVGVWLESRLALGLEIVRIVSEDQDIAMGEALRDLGYPIIALQGAGARGLPVEIVFVVEKRKNVGALVMEVEQVDPNAYCTVSEVKRHVSAATLSMAARDRARRFPLKQK